MTDLMSRRRFLAASLGLLPALATAQRAGAGHPAAAVDRWIVRVQRTTEALQEGRIGARAWRRRVRRLTRRVPLPGLLRVLDFRDAALAMDSLETDEPQRRLALPLPPGLHGFAFTAILARLDAGAAVVPHGHHNMVSMHLVLDGAVRVTQYDRLRDEPEHLLLRPRADRLCRPGDTTAITPDRRNVHWFRPVVDSFALIVATYDLDPNAEPAQREFVDPLAAERQPDGSLRVPRLTAEEAARLYGRA